MPISILASKPTSPSVSALEIEALNTAWVFLAGQADPRHLDDILFGILTLARKGVPSSSIYVFADHPMVRLHLKHAPNVNIFDPIHFESKVSEITEKHLVVSVTGHGHNLGISCRERSLISPNGLLETVRSPKNLESASIIICQCYAGIFNFLDARTSPPVCILGATNLHMSLSVPTKTNQPFKSLLTGEDFILEWDANIFFTRFFVWIGSAIDVDGDGKKTVLDAYRFAGSLSNDEFRRYKKIFANVQSELREELKSLRPEDDAQGIRKKALEDNIERFGDLLHLHQEPWILHPDFARKVTVLL